MTTENLTASDCKKAWDNINPGLVCALRRQEYLNMRSVDAIAQIIACDCPYAREIMNRIENPEDGLAARSDEELEQLETIIKGFQTWGREEQWKEIVLNMLGTIRRQNKRIDLVEKNISLIIASRNLEVEMERRRFEEQGR
jgi:hypothetical protein